MRDIRFLRSVVWMSLDLLQLVIDLMWLWWIWLYQGESFSIHRFMPLWYSPNYASRKSVCTCSDPKIFIRIDGSAIVWADVLGFVLTYSARREVCRWWLWTCRVEERFPIRKSIEQTKGQRLHIQYGMEQKTNLGYSIGHTGITTPATCCRWIRVVVAKWVGTVYIAQNRPFLAEPAMINVRPMLGSFK